MLGRNSGSASEFILDLAASATDAAAAEMNAAEQLRALSTAKGGQTGALSAVQGLEAAIAQASKFHRLEACTLQNMPLKNMKVNVLI